MSIGAFRWDAELKISLCATKNGGYVFALRSLTDGLVPDECDLFAAMTPQDAVGTLSAAVCQAMGLDFGAFVAGIAGVAQSQALSAAVRCMLDVSADRAEDAPPAPEEGIANNVKPSEATPAPAEAPPTRYEAVAAPVLVLAPPPATHEETVKAHAAAVPLGVGFTVKDAAAWLAEPEHRARKVLEAMVNAGRLALGERRKVGQLYTLAPPAPATTDLPEPAPNIPPESDRELRDPDDGSPRDLEDQLSDLMPASASPVSPDDSAEPDPLDAPVAPAATGPASPAVAQTMTGALAAMVPGFVFATDGADWHGRSAAGDAILIRDTMLGDPSRPLYVAAHARADGVRDHTGESRPSPIAALESLKAKMSAPREPVTTREPAAAPATAAPAPDRGVDPSQPAASPLDALRARHPDYVWAQVVAGADRSYRGTLPDGPMIVLARTSPDAGWLGKAYDAAKKATGTGTPAADIVQAANYVIIAARRNGEALPAAPKPAPVATPAWVQPMAVAADGARKRTAAPAATTPAATAPTPEDDDSDSFGDLPDPDANGDDEMF